MEEFMIVLYLALLGAAVLITSIIVTQNIIQTRKFLRNANVRLEYIEKALDDILKNKSCQ